MDIGKLTRELIPFDKNRNSIFSPLSIAYLLDITENATGGKTRDEIQRLTGARTPFIDSASLSIANAVCVRTDLRKTIKAGYKEHLKKEFNGELFASKNMAEDVNSWTSIKTNGLITKILDEDRSLLILLNATAFSGEWNDIYFDEDIWKGTFTDFEGNISDVNMMHSTETLYVENMHVTGIVKPYKGGEFSFMAMLPNKMHSKALEISIKSTDLTGIFRKRRRETVVTMIPEFKAGMEIDLKNYLAGKNIRTLFTDDADFSNISTTKLKVGSIKHKAVILDRPFFYAIMHNETGMPVFVGVMNKNGYE